MTSTVWTADLVELRSLVREVASDALTATTIHELVERESPYDAGIWRTLCEVGLPGLGVPEELDGTGTGQLHLVWAMEALGRELVPSPLLASVLSVGALRTIEPVAGAADRVRGLVSALAAGTRTATLVRAGSGAPEAVATETATGWRLTGTVSHVLDGHTADDLLVAAVAPQGEALFHVIPDTGTVRSGMETIDATRPQARVVLEDVPADLLAGPSDRVRPDLDAAVRTAGVALAAEEVGAAQRCLEMSLEYARVREQFGRPIGSFQAIKHKCVDVHLEIECARAAVHEAAEAIDTGSEHAALLARVASHAGREALTTAATEGIQIHGGIGFTWEHPAHLYFRRAVSAGSLLWTGRVRDLDGVADTLLGAVPSAAPRRGALPAFAIPKGMKG